MKAHTHTHQVCICTRIAGHTASTLSVRRKTGTHPAGYLLLHHKPCTAFSVTIPANYRWSRMLDLLQGATVLPTALPCPHHS